MRLTTREQRRTARVENSDASGVIQLMGSHTCAREEDQFPKRGGRYSARKVVPTIKYVDGDSSHDERGWISGWDTRDLVEVDTCRIPN